MSNWILDEEEYDFTGRVCKKCARINTHRLDKDGNFTCDGEWMDVPEGMSAETLSSIIKGSRQAEEGKLYDEKEIT